MEWMGLLDLLVELQAEREPWRVDAECRTVDGDVFFEGRAGRERDERGHFVGPNVVAREVCGRCAVRLECLEFALRTGQQHGIWGGLTECERRDLRRGMPKRGRGPALPVPRELSA